MANYTRIGTASLRQIPFDFKGNVERVLIAIKKAQDAEVNLLLLPELALTGYGCEDNFTFQEFNQASEVALYKVIERFTTINHSFKHSMLVALGMPLMYPGGQIFNAIAIFSQAGLHGFSCKQFLARSGLHYEPRWFERWERGKVVLHPKFKVPMGDIVVDADGLRIGFETCEDSWISNRPGRDLYQRNVDVILNPSASHFAVGKYTTREQFVREGSRAFGVVYAYANLSGTENGTSIYDAGCLIASEGQIISKGDRLNVKDVLLNHTLVNISANRVSRIVNSESIKNDETNSVTIAINLSQQSEALKILKLHKQAQSANDNLPNFWHGLHGDDLAFTEISYAISNGLWDWMIRTRTSGFVVSLSGGADSGLVSTLVYLSQRLALQQLGSKVYSSRIAQCLSSSIPQRHAGQDKLKWLKQDIMPLLLWCLYQSTENSSQTTLNAAQQVSKEIGARFDHWDIQPLVQKFTNLVNGLYSNNPLSWEKDDITLQNIQARARSPGIWMIANRENKLLIATSNLSESALGYATMDGDTSGVIAAISGISKSTIRKMNLWLEKVGMPIQSDAGFQRVRLNELKWINLQQPTAELRPDAQTDEEDLMPYEVCDFIMECYLVKQMWPKSILIELLITGYGKKYDVKQLGCFVERWFKLFCRNPWKRYGTRAGFHIEQISLDPKTFHRFPLLNSGFSEPLEQMWNYIKTNSTDASD
ncbi:NAD(+) synthase [Aliiglaciecola sp. LCG003]|uniref:NAD(+) synthase n=1 Tax=Aliiglaciecola sp. LCG003 TaxID=3053655 RepID=UPI0025742EA9|nr:NAD(+) synthase [Aliiglaciecola sp. LCG003]WJG10874.1 NAD(+) synthase [Aliiglaciecola sp. LCG003]